MLVLTPKPHPTECISGYLYQLSKANRYDRPSWIIEPYRKGYHADDYRRITPTVMQEIANLPSDEAQRVCVRPDRTGDRTTLRLVGTELHASHVDMRSFRICPDCVAQDDRHEAFWHLRLVEWCPIHQVRLLTHCWNCGHQLRWNRPGIGRCNCGADLTEQRSSERCDDRLSGLLLVLRRALYGSEYAGEAIPQEMSHLLHMDLYRLMRTAEVLSEVLGGLQGRDEARTLHSEPSASREEKASLLGVAKILSPWPEAFREFLHARYDKKLTEDGSRMAFRDEFSWAHYSLGKHLKEHAGQLAFLREEVAHFGAAYWTQEKISRGGSDLGLSQESFRWCSVPEAAELLGIDRRTLLKRIHEGVVPVRESPIRLTNRNFQVDLKWARSQPYSAYSEIKIRSAAGMLGLSPGVLSVLQERRVYQPAILTKRNGTFAIEDLQKFKMKLEALVIKHSKSEDISGITFRGRRYGAFDSDEERAHALHALLEA